MLIKNICIYFLGSDTTKHKKTVAQGELIGLNEFKSYLNKSTVATRTFLTINLTQKVVVFYLMVISILAINS